MNTTTLATILEASTYETPSSYDIFPYASYVAIACVLLFILFIIIARLVITVDTQQTDLVLFNKTPQKHLVLLVSKQLYNTAAAQNNIQSAIAAGLMEPPPNYDMSKINTAAVSVKTMNTLTDMSTKTSTTTLNSTVNENIPNTNGRAKMMESFDSIEPTPVKASSKRSKW